MVEMDYRTDKEKAKGKIIEDTLRDVKLIQARIKQLLLLDWIY